MEWVPGRAHLMAGERVSGGVTLRNNRAVELLYDNSLWRKHRALIRSPEGKRQTTVPRATTLSCDVESNPAEHP